MSTPSKGFLCWGYNINDNELWIFLSSHIIRGWGGELIHIQTNFLLLLNSQTFEFNIFPNHHQLDDHQVQEYLNI
jgi:hypothetical protein